MICSINYCNLFVTFHYTFNVSRQEFISHIKVNRKYEIIFCIKTSMIKKIFECIIVKLYPSNFDYCNMTNISCTV